MNFKDSYKAANDSLHADRRIIDDLFSKRQRKRKARPVYAYGSIAAALLLIAGVGVYSGTLRNTTEKEAVITDTAADNASENSAETETAEGAENAENAEQLPNTKGNEGTGSAQGTEQKPDAAVRGGQSGGAQAGAPGTGNKTQPSEAGTGGSKKTVNTPAKTPKPASAPETGKTKQTAAPESNRAADNTPDETHPAQSGIREEAAQGSAQDSAVQSSGAERQPSEATQADDAAKKGTQSKTKRGADNGAQAAQSTVPEQETVYAEQSAQGSADIKMSREAVDAASGGAAFGGAASGGGSAARDALPNYDVLTCEEYYAYIGRDMSDITLPEGMKLSAPESVNIYYDDEGNITSDKAVFRAYGRSGTEISVTTAMLSDTAAEIPEGGAVKKILNGRAAVVENEKGIYRAYVENNGVHYSVTAEGVSVEELEALLLSLTL